MIRGTTPVLKFGLPFSTRTIAAAFVTFNQGTETVMEKSGDEITKDGNELIVSLTQEETLELDTQQQVEIQIRVKLNDGSALASNIIYTTVGRILKDGEI